MQRVGGISANMRLEDQGYVVTLNHAWDYDTYDLMIWQRTPEGAFQIVFGENGTMDRVKVEDGEMRRPTLRIGGHLAPLFFRLFGEAADQMGVLPDVVSAQIATLKAENSLLREMLERADRAGLEHRGDLRMLTDHIVRKLG